MPLGTGWCSPVRRRQYRGCGSGRIVHLGWFPGLLAGLLTAFCGGNDRGVSFCDVAGLAVLIGAQRRARARRITV